MTHVAGKGELQMAKRAAGWRSESLRTMAVERLRACIHIGRLCEELGVSRSQLGRWQKEFESRHAAEPARGSLITGQLICNKWGSCLSTVATIGCGLCFECESVKG